MPRDPRSRPGPRAAAKRELIVETPVRTFAERGYQGAKVEDVAAELGISKGSVERTEHLVQEKENWARIG